jgi:adenosylmethionine-8-amino-7-oxononanoate aminotransferase
MATWFAASISRKEETTADLNRVARAIQTEGGTIAAVQVEPIVNTGNCQWVISYQRRDPLHLPCLVDQIPGPKPL